MHRRFRTIAFITLFIALALNAPALALPYTVTIHNATGLNLEVRPGAQMCMAHGVSAITIAPGAVRREVIDTTTSGSSPMGGCSDLHTPSSTTIQMFTAEGGRIHIELWKRTLQPWRVVSHRQSGRVLARIDAGLAIDITIEGR